MRVPRSNTAKKSPRTRKGLHADALIATVRESFEPLPDSRQGPVTVSLADLLWSLVHRITMKPPELLIDTARRATRRALGYPPPGTAITSVAWCRGRSCTSVIPGLRFTAGVVLYDGETSAGFGDNLYAVPIRSPVGKNSMSSRFDKRGTLLCGLLQLDPSNLGFGSCH